MCSPTRTRRVPVRSQPQEGSCGEPLVKLSEGLALIGQAAEEDAATRGRVELLLQNTFRAPGFVVGRYIQGLFMHAWPHLATNIISVAAASNKQEEQIIVHLICVMYPHITKRPFWETL